MKKQMKFLVQILVFVTILLSSCQVLAVDVSAQGGIQLSKEFERYLDLSEDEREGLLLPRAYEIPKVSQMVKNPLRLARMLGSSSSSSYSLLQDIPKNMIVKNQQQTNSCWAFSILASLESNLALKNNDNVAYDFSERHMEYATSQSFLNGAKNPLGFNRKAGDGGYSYLYVPYLTNGSGAIPEQEMPFENNEKSIYISEIQNKTVVTQVNDIIEFPSYGPSDDKTLIKQQMKEHIKNYGAIDAGIFGASLGETTCYNNKTGAIYCNSESRYPINHAVPIVGWDDNYSVENFLENARPRNNGAWIIRNSWGVGGETYTLAQMKEYIYNNYPEECEKNGWTSPESISDELTLYNFKRWGFTIDENNVATLKVGDKGFMYVSYEDVNIYNQLTGIVDSQTELTYENIYQYDEFGGALQYPMKVSKVYLSTVNERKTSGVEYLTQVSIHASETYTCKVYINPNGTSMEKSDLQQVQLKAGETEVFGAGYHTIEFLNPVQITGSNFVVVLEIQASDSGASIIMECNLAEFAAKQPAAAELASALPIYNNVTVEKGKTFLTIETGFNTNEWFDTAAMFALNKGQAPDFNTTLKAFTVSKIESLESIAITTPPTKTSYIVGEDFDARGMVVKANYSTGRSEQITDYTITNGTNLAIGQTTVTIEFEGKTATQTISVVENTLESIAITTPPTKTEYWAGEDFDATGMVVKAIYKDGTKENITNYTIQNGTALQNGQTTVTIAFEGKTATQAITVKANVVTKIEITHEPTKTQYVVGQSFDSAGMIVKATYENGTEKDVPNYEIKDGANLQLNQTTVTIEFEGQTATQAITVIEKAITGISVKTMPVKTEYIQNKEKLDLTGGVIEVSYNDETKEELPMTSSGITAEGFDNKELGTKTITITYLGKTTQFNVEIKELPKPENSNFDNAQADVEKVRTYTYTDANKKGHVIVEVQITNLNLATVNDKTEYYYSLSKNPTEENITNWIKIKNIKNVENKIHFEMDTRDIENYEELVDADKLYLYVKEIAIRNEMKKEIITKSLEIEAENEKFELYVDDVLKQEVNSDQITNPTPGEDTDKTLAPGTIPNAGKNLIMLIMLLILVIGRIAYIKYKDIELR